jgi:tetratricopeptide (TPR) repeat protein
MRRAVQMAPAREDLLRRYLDVLLLTREYQAMLDETGPTLAKSGGAWWFRGARGTAFARLKDQAQALREFEAGLEAASAQKDESAAAWLVQAIAQEVDAQEALRYATKRAESDNRWRLITASLYHGIHDDANAVAAIEGVLAEQQTLSPEDQNAALRLGAMIYWTSRNPPPRPELAVKLYRQLLVRCPDDYQALNNLAVVLVDSVNPAEPQQALVYSQRVYELMQKSGLRDPIVLDTHGWVLTLCGRSKEGIELLRDAAARGSLAESHYHLGEAYLRESSPREAAEQLAAAQALMDKARREQQPVDAGLERRILEAMARARAAMPAATTEQAPAVPTTRQGEMAIP